MAKIRTKISVSGFNEAEITAGLEDFRQEFSERFWLENPNAIWDSDRNLLIVTVETEGGDPKNEAEGVLDEIRDCVIACFNFSSERVSFDILEAEFIE
jgi:hypothetical protein